MIATLTANPSLDRTIELPGSLIRGAVQRATAAHQEPGGKGVNVCRALAASGTCALAVLPGDAKDPVLQALLEAGIPFRNLPIGTALRSNITLTEPDGTTTKVNEPGPELTADQQQRLIELVLEHSAGAGWLVLAGSLPPGVGAGFYAEVMARVRRDLGTTAPRIAVDTSGPALAAVVGPGITSVDRAHRMRAPDLIKPNAEELAELTGLPVTEADPQLALKAAQSLVDDGVGAVLATLGARGGLLVTPDGGWLAEGLPVTARSTVGAGDSALAGYLLAQMAGAAPADCLRQSIAHGAAAASLPGSTVPTRQQTIPESVIVAEIPIPREVRTSEGR